MFESLKKSSASSRSSARSEGPSLSRTNGFVRALVQNNLRITYSALATASAELGEHTPSGLSAGQRGAQLVRNLEPELQPHVCRSNGAYKKGTTWPVEVPGDLRSREHVGPDEILAYVEVYVENEAGASDDEVDADAVIEALDDEQDEALEDASGANDPDPVF